MKVLYYHQYFHTPNAASGIRSYQMAQALIRAGHSVTMVCGASELREQLELPEWKHGIRRGVIDGIDVIQFKINISNYFSLPRRAWTFLRFALKSSVLALREDYDMLFATSTPLTAGIPGIVMKWCRRKPFVFEVRDLWPELPREMGIIKNPVLLSAMSFLEWLTYRTADACIGLSPGIVEGIRKRSPDKLKITMIPNAADLDLFICGNREALDVSGVANSDFVAVFMGAHGIANGLDAVLAAAEQLKVRERKDIKLVLIGDGKEKPRLMKQAEALQLDNVIFLDLIPKVTLGAMLGNYDAGLMILANVPAFYYGTSPNKFFDYLSAGLPVINNYPGWLADMIREHQCGITVPPDDAGAFANALERLANLPAEAQQMGTNARVLAENYFARERLSESFVHWLEKFGTR